MIQLIFNCGQAKKWVIAQRWILGPIGLWAGQHLLLFGLVGLFQHLYQQVGLPPTDGSASYALIGPFIRWDSQYYSYIAEHGYTQAFLGAFPPLYPALAALFTPVFGSATSAGLVIANACGLGSCLILRKVLDPILGEQISQRTLFFLLAFPTAMFFMAEYTESLFLLLSLAMFLSLQRRAFWWAALFAGLGMLTRYTGVVLMVPLVLTLWQTRADWKGCLSAAFAPLGVVIFWLWFFIRFGTSPNAELWSYWHRRLSWPWEGLVRSVAYLASPHPSLVESVNTIRDLVLTLCILILLIGLVRLEAVPLTLKLYTALLILFALANPIYFNGVFDALFSMPRYALVAFPLFIPLAVWGAHSKTTQLSIFTIEALVTIYMLAAFSAMILVA